jgi:serine/threonine protein kinase
VGERAAYPASACAGDDGLCREVQALLDVPASAAAFLAAPAAAIAADMVSGPADSVLSGRRLGVYEVRERIGAGGMGKVYRARDTKLDRAELLEILSA